MPTTSRRRFLLLMGGGVAGAGLLGWHRWGSPGRLTRTSAALGTEVSITTLGGSERAIDSAFAAIEEVEQVMSLYRHDSQVSILNREGRVEDPHPCLVEVLQAGREMSQRSGGAFDVTVQPLWNLRSEGASEACTVAEARRKVDWRKLTIRRGRIRVAPGMEITLNGIAQGYAADRAMAALREQGVEHALVDTGELIGLGVREDGSPWKAGIQHPRQTDAWIELAALDGRCMATSGDYNTRNHIFDPATGATAGEFSSVTVMAPDGMTADALSTAVFVTGLERGAKLVGETGGADAFFVLNDGKTFTTRGFPRLT